jgi:hypothetical protein
VLLQDSVTSGDWFSDCIGAAYVCVVVPDGTRRFGAGFGIPIPAPGPSTRTRHPPHTRRRVKISTIPVNPPGSGDPTGTRQVPVEA